jgi:hypothetical protein
MRRRACADVLPMLGSLGTAWGMVMVFWFGTTFRQRAQDRVAGEGAIGVRLKLILVRAGSTRSADVGTSTSARSPRSRRR